MAAQFLVAPEVLSDCAIVGIVVLVALGLCYRNEIELKWRHASIGFAIAATILAAIGAYPAYEMLAATGHLSGPVAGVSHLQSFRNDLLEAVLPTARQFIAPAWIVKTLHLPTRDVNETGGYLSIPLLLAMIVALVTWWRDRVLRVLGFAALVALVLSLGSRLSIDGHLFSFPLPEAVLAHLPVLDSTVPDRFSLIVAFTVAAMFGIGLDRSLTAASSRPQGPRLMIRGGVGAVGVIVLVALAPRLPIPEPPLLFPATLPAAISDQVPRGGVLLTYPYASPPFNEAMLFQADEGFAYRLLGGYATVRGTDGAGEYWPVLLQPEVIQEFLSQEEAGVHGHYPLPQAAATSDAVCNYLARYKVTTVVIWTDATNASTVAQTFENALGPPVTPGPELDVFQVHTVAGIAGTQRC
jgi:hypothetical protein